jgi:hypothetical protein
MRNRTVSKAAAKTLSSPRPPCRERNAERNVAAIETAHRLGTASDAAARCVG